MEVIFCFLMLDNDFIIFLINVEMLVDGINEGEIVISFVENVGFDSVMINSFGFGGINGLMIMLKYIG